MEAKDQVSYQTSIFSVAFDITFPEKQQISPEN